MERLQSFWFLLLLVCLGILGLGVVLIRAFVGGTCAPGGHALPIGGVELRQGEGADLVVDIIVQLVTGGRHLLL